MGLAEGEAGACWLVAVWRHGLHAGLLWNSGAWHCRCWSSLQAVLLTRPQRQFPALPGTQVYERTVYSSINYW